MQVASFHKTPSTCFDSYGGCFRRHFTFLIKALMRQSEEISPSQGIGGKFSSFKLVKTLLIIWIPQRRGPIFCARSTQCHLQKGRNDISHSSLCIERCNRHFVKIVCIFRLLTIWCVFQYIISVIFRMVRFLFENILKNPSLFFSYVRWIEIWNVFSWFAIFLDSSINF